MAQFWVHPNLNEVDYKIKEHDQDSVKEYRAHNHGVISIKGGINEKTAQAWDEEERLNYKGA